jgi:NH3-dependent NAD+ synthetase
VLDLILFGLERFMTTRDISDQLGIEEAEIVKVKNRWLGVEHKRRMPLTPKLEFRTVGTDFRLPHGVY